MIPISACIRVKKNTFDKDKIYKEVLIDLSHSKRLSKFKHHLLEQVSL